MISVLLAQVIKQQEDKLKKEEERAAIAQHKHMRLRQEREAKDAQRAAEQQALLSSLGETQSFDEGLDYAEVEARHLAAVPGAPATVVLCVKNI